MILKIYQIDAFTDTLFKGNPAAICVLDNWIDSEQMQTIAMENNLSETAFIVKVGGLYEIRWFTPMVEVKLCGHATLAAAYVLSKYYSAISPIQFNTLHRGMLIVNTLENGYFELDFPVEEVIEISSIEAINKALNITPINTYKGKTDYLLLLKNQSEVLSLNPDFGALALCPGRGIIVTSQGKDVDFVSRFFGPQSGINEDPVTGSAHTLLTPFWANKLNKKSMSALQLSPRGGQLNCRLEGSRVYITGTVAEYLQGTINI